MNKKTAKWATATGAAALLLLGSGCARIQDVDALQAEIDSLKGELSAAQDAAASARAEAEAARAAAGNAASAADSAMSAANDAQASGAANSEKLERMLEKVMMK